MAEIPGGTAVHENGYMAPHGALLKRRHLDGCVSGPPMRLWPVDVHKPLHKGTYPSRVGPPLVGRVSPPRQGRVSPPILTTSSKGRVSPPICYLLLIAKSLLRRPALGDKLRLTPMLSANR